MGDFAGTGHRWNEIAICGKKREVIARTGAHPPAASTMKKATRIRLTKLLPALLALALALPSCEMQREENPDVIILHTGRMRGNVYPLSTQGIAPLQHYQYIASYVKTLREEAAQTGAEVFLVDLGDSLDGSFASYATGGENMVAYFNALGYDAILLGNLDNNAMPELLEQIKAGKLNPFIGPDGSPATEGTIAVGRFERGDIPIYLVANFYGDTEMEAYPDRFPTWFGSTPEMVHPLRDYAAALEAADPRPDDALTAFSWMKFESPAEPPEGFLEELCELGVDVILAHRIYSGDITDAWTDSGFYDWQPPISENILRNNGGFAMARVDLKRDNGSWRVLRHELLPMTANTAPADPEIVAAMEEFAPIIAAADQVLFELPEGVDPDTILKVYMQALRQVPDTDVVIYSPQSIRAPWPSGDLTASRVFNSLPWTAEVVQVQLAPGELDRIKENNPRLLLLTKAEPADGPVTLTTSRYFASIFLPQLGRPLEHARPVESGNEFEMLLNHLENSTDPLGVEPEGGWVFESSAPNQP